ncbi:hypothetical protein ACFL96_04190 [Thermoproteota archaeon]
MTKLNQSEWHLDNRGTLIEWRYFNITDKKMFGFFSYFISKFPNKAGQVYVVSRIYKDQKIYGDFKRFKLEDSHIQGQDIVISKNGKIKFDKKNNVRIKGKVSNVSWDLNYKNEIPEEFPMDKFIFGPFGLKNIAWKIFMPYAKVTGSIKIDDNVYDINTGGYMDGNWGRWLVYEIKWDWINFARYKSKNKNFIVTVGNIHKRKSGVINVVHNGETIHFAKEKKEYTIKRKKWNKKMIPSVPIETSIVGKKGDYILNIHTTSEFVDKIEEKTPLKIVNIYLFEEKVFCTAELYKKIDGELKLVNSYKGEGFAEYSSVYSPKLHHLRNKIKHHLFRR